MAPKEMRSMMQGAAVLTVASFLVKILSAIYRVPFQNIVGDEGFYVYQQVYPIYGLAMTLALSGLPLFLSKVVAETPDPQIQVRRLKSLYPVVFWLSVSLAASIFGGADFLAAQMGDAALAPLIRMASLVFLLVPPLAFYRGRYQGNMWVVPTAVSQVVEQCLRVGIILCAAYTFTLGQDVYQTGTGAMLGGLVGGFGAWLVLRYYQKKWQQPSIRYSVKGEAIEPRFIRRFLLEGGLVILYGSLLILFQLVDSFVVKNALVASGMTDQAAKVAKGIYDRGQPLVQLGLVLALALGSTFLPMLVKAFVAKERHRFTQHAQQYLRLTAAIGLAASLGLALLLPYVNYALFKDNAGNAAIGLFVFAIFLMGLIQTYQNISQSQNRFLAPILSVVLGLILKGVTSYPLTRQFGLVGASWSTLLGLAGCLISLIVVTKIKVWRRDGYWWRLGLSLLAMVVALFVYEGALTLIMSQWHRGTSLLAAIGGVFWGASVLLWCMIRLRVFSIREWLLLPYGSKLLRIGRKKDALR